jgi:hypothetical protein
VPVEVPHGGASDPPKSHDALVDLDSTSLQYLGTMAYLTPSGQATQVFPRKDAASLLDRLHAIEAHLHTIEARLDLILSKLDPP